MNKAMLAGRATAAALEAAGKGIVRMATCLVVGIVITAPIVGAGWAAQALAEAAGAGEFAATIAALAAVAVALGAVGAAAFAVLDEIEAAATAGK